MLIQFQLEWLESPTGFRYLPMKKYQEIASKMLEEWKNLIFWKTWDSFAMGKFISRIPDPNCEIAIVGKVHQKKHGLQKGYLPNSLIAFSEEVTETAPN